MAINLDLVILAKDLTGAAFKGFQSNLKQTGVVVGGLGKGFLAVSKEVSDFRQAQTDAGKEGVTSASVLNSGLLTVLGTIGLLTTAYAQLQKAASSAIDAQFERVTDINTISQTLGTNLKESSKLTDEARKQISEFGVNLPISTGDVRTAYSLVIDDYAAALKGKLSNEDIVKTTTADAARLGIIRGSLNDTGKVAFSSNISALLSGSIGVGGFNQLALAQNVQFKNAYLDEMKKRGVQNLNQLDPGTKIQAFNAILEKVVTPEQTALLQGTARAQLSSITDRLFDPESGIFSFARNLSKDGSKRLTVIDEATKTLDLLFGDKGLVTQLGKLGFFGTGDPMMPFLIAVQSLNSYIENVGKGLEGLKSVSPVLAGEIIGKGIADVVNAVVNGIVSAIAVTPWGDIAIGIISGIGAVLANLDWKIYVLAAVGIAAAVIIPQIVGAIVLFASIFFGLLSVVVSGGVVLLVAAAGLAIAGLVRFIIQNFDGIKARLSGAWNATTSAIGGVINATGSFFKSTWKSFVEEYYAFSDNAEAVLSGAYESIINGSISFFNSVDQWFNNVLISTGNFIQNTWNSLVTNTSNFVSWAATATSDGLNSIVDSSVSFFDFVSQNVSSATSATGDWLSSTWDSFVANSSSFLSKTTSVVGSAFDSVVNGTINFFQEVGKWISNVFQPVGDAINGIIDQIKAILNSILQPIQSAVGGLISTASSVLNPGSVASNIGGAISGATNAVGSALSSATNSVLSFFGARYMGNIPWKNAASGLYDAIDQEVANKPSSAGLVVANTSELILPQSQIAPFLSANSRGNVTVNVGGISFNLTGNTSEAIAQQAIQIIESRLASELESVLA